MRWAYAVRYRHVQLLRGSISNASDDESPNKIQHAQPLLALLGRFGGLGLFGATELLRTVLALLPQLAVRLRWRSGKASPNQSVLGLKLPLRLLVVVDQRKACAASTTELRPEAERNHARLFGLVDFGELLRELGLGDVCPRRVEDIHDELAASKETVGDEFARPDGDGCC